MEGRAMIPVLEFVFQSFWTFMGSAILLGIVVSPLHALLTYVGRR